MCVSPCVDTCVFGYMIKKTRFFLQHGGYWLDSFFCCCLFDCGGEPILNLDMVIYVIFILFEFGVKYCPL